MEKNKEQDPEEFQEIQIPADENNQNIYLANSEVFNQGGPNTNFVNAPVYGQNPVQYNPNAIPPNPNAVYGQNNPPYGQNNPPYGQNNPPYAQSNQPVPLNPQNFGVPYYPPGYQNPNPAAYNYQGNNYPQTNIPPVYPPNYQANPVPNQVNVNPDNITAEDRLIIKYGRIVRILSAAEMILALLYLISVPFLLILIVLDLMGFIGGRNFNKRLTIGYVVYLGIFIIARIIIMGFFPFVYLIIIYTLVIAFEIYQILINLKFFMLIRYKDFTQAMNYRNLTRIVYGQGQCSCFV